MARTKRLMVRTVVLVTILFTMTTMAAEVPRMTKEELKEMLGNQDVIIVDTRIGTDWNGSEFKIKGAVREDPTKVSEWIEKYPRDKTFVFYCA